MKPIGPTPQDVQDQVDLAGGGTLEHRTMSWRRREGFR
jgi:hypothetical protein